MLQIFRNSTTKFFNEATRKKSDFAAARREFRRLKLLNTLSPDFTGEQGVHQWMDAKKLRVLGKLYEDQRNKHAKTIKVDPKDAESYRKQYEEISEQEYLRKQQEQYWRGQFMGSQQNVMIELMTLPHKLREEIQNLKPRNDTQYSPRLENFNMYYDQIMRLYPEVEAQNQVLAKRILKVITDKLQQGD